jgi:hypothetical protein
VLGAALVWGALWKFGPVAKTSADKCENEDEGIWFVHATDPHLFLKAIKADGKEARVVEQETLEKKAQEPLNEEALADMLKRIRSLPGGEGPSAFLVLTGDFGIDPCEICKTATQPNARTLAECLDADPTKQIEKIAKVLGDNPVPNIYLVAGNNDIANESAGDEALKYFNDLIDAVQAKLDPGKVKLHNLTRGYLSGESPERCYADIPHTNYRLIGFPSYSFKTRQEKAQGAQFEKFRQLLADSRRQGMKALVITHTPEMDDPFALAQQRYATPRSTPTPAPTASTAASAAPTPAPTTSPAASAAPAATAIPAETSTPAGTATPAQKTKKAQTQADKSSSVATWNVSEQLLDDWAEAITSESMVGVFAGHLHDSHKEIYRRPYAWSSGSPAAFRKLFLAPPLAVKNQDTSPIQARGFSLVHLQPDRIESHLYWYDSETRAFARDSTPKSRCERRHSWRNFCHDSGAAIRWLWNLDTGKALERMAVLLIAFLTAFLTIVAIWQIPPAGDPFADVKKTEGESKPAQPGPTNGSSDSPFSNKLGKTVIAGLAGLVAAEVTKTLGNEKPSPDLRWYYIVWFILFFFLLLLSLNLWRAAVEALRSRVAVVYYPARKGGDVTPWDVFRHWLSSLRVPLLTFSDTFINLIQGKNQTRTRVFSDTIIEQQQNVVRVAGAIRTNLNRWLEGRVRDGAPAESPPRALSDQLELVRVNISVLSKDQTNVFYISRAPGSSHSTFEKHSVAWASVYTGVPLWFQSTYHDLEFDKIVLLKEGSIPDEKGDILLKDFYQKRPQVDYKAFIILPVPSPRRGLGSDYVKGAIQISFQTNEDFESIWKGNEMSPTPDNMTYKTSQRTLEDWCQHADIRIALSNSIATLGELLRGFNEIIYKNYIEPNQPD